MTNTYLASVRIITILTNTINGDVENRYLVVLYS